MGRCLLTPGFAISEAPTAAPTMLGFTASGAVAQQALEKRFDAALNADDLRGWLQRLSAEANHVGAPHDKANAEFMLQQFRDWGWQAEIETFYVLYPDAEERHARAGRAHDLHR